MFRTVTTRLPGLDTLRALAILLVMIFHLGYLLPTAFAPIVQIGWMGVDLFFVLSGYLIGLQLLRPYLRGKAVSLFDFYRRRALRILPAYLAVVALYFLWPAWREQPGLSPLWQFLTFTENLFVDYAQNKAFSHAWSLCVEEHFYLVLPLLVLILMRRPSVGRAVFTFVLFFALGIALRTFVLLHVLQATPITDEHWYVLYYEYLYYPTWTRLDGLLAGVALASIQTFRPAWWTRLTDRGNSLTVAAVLLVTAAAWLFAGRNESDTGVAAWGSVLGFPLLALGFTLLVVAAVSTNGLLGRLRIPGAQTLATMAFTLYLTHKEAAHLVRLHVPSWTAERDLKALILYTAACLSVAAVLHLCAERPFLRFSRSSPHADQGDPPL